MTTDNAQAILDRVISYCESVIRLDNAPYDEEVWTCERIMKIINEEQEKQ
jgi:hypothetical protein